MNVENYKAVILDLDGVITQTANLHARAWKEMFDDFLRSRFSAGKKFQPFDLQEDYARYVDGKPRYDGVQSFLSSRGIELPYGNTDDDPKKDTVCGLGSRKNDLFHQLIKSQGVDVYKSSDLQLKEWKKKAIPMAVVSSSRNCRLILKESGLEDFFQVVVDGTDLERLDIPGKPEPDIFLEAAKELGVSPKEAIVVEDAIAGVQAGRRGNFGLVVGIDRQGSARDLKEEGADIVLSELNQIGEISQNPSMLGPNPALECLDQIKTKMFPPPPVLFLDYDGTLTPIVKHPSEATLSEEIRDVLKSLSKNFYVTVVSGRDRMDVEKLVGLTDINYAGSHGFDIRLADGTTHQLEEAKATLDDLSSAEDLLQEKFKDIEGVLVERKKYAIAIHYRNAKESAIGRIEDIVDQAATTYPSLRKRGGKKIFELQPDLEWNKGQAILWILEKLRINSQNALPIYLGDDLTDEDAFEVLADRGLSFLIGIPTFASKADYFLKDQNEVKTFFENLHEWKQESENPS